MTVTTTDPVLDQKALRASLARQGIDSLDALVERLAETAASCQMHDEPLFALQQRHAPAPASNDLANVHKSPLAALFVDGSRRKPDQISDFDGFPLYSTPRFAADDAPVLHSFTTAAGLAEFVAASGDIGTTNPDSLSELALYYSDDGNGGDHLQNGPGKAWANLTRVPRGFLHLSDWNDVISSVDWCRWDISLYENIGYGGSQLYLPAGRTYFHLSDFGWNDRASATVNWGRRF